MKNLLPFFFVSLMSATSFAQMQIDKSIDMTGTNTSDRAVTNLAPPVNGTDAANKDYVDAQVAAVAGGGGSSKPSQMSNESASSFTIKDAVQYCENLTEATFSDWRLPSIEELTYFVGDGSATSNYLWTKSQATGKENPVNQNYAVIRLSDGKWRNAGEVTGLLLARNVNTGIINNNALSTWTTLGSITPLTAGNVIIPTHINLTGQQVSSSSGLAQAIGEYRLKMNFADGSSSYSSVFTQSSSTTSTLVDMQSIPLLTSVTPLTSIDLEMQSSGGGSTYRHRGIITVSGYEISMTQKDGNTLKARCVR